MKGALLFIFANLVAIVLASASRARPKVVTAVNPPVIECKSSYSKEGERDTEILQKCCPDLLVPNSSFVGAYFMHMETYPSCKILQYASAMQSLRGNGDKNILRGLVIQMAEDKTPLYVFKRIGSLLGWEADISLFKLYESQVYGVDLNETPLAKALKRSNELKVRENLIEFVKVEADCGEARPKNNDYCTGYKKNLDRQLEKLKGLESTPKRNFTYMDLISFDFGTNDKTRAARKRSLTASSEAEASLKARLEKSYAEPYRPQRLSQLYMDLKYLTRYENYAQSDRATREAATKTTVLFKEAFLQEARKCLGDETSKGHPYLVSYILTAILDDYCGRKRSCMNKQLNFILSKQETHPNLVDAYTRDFKHNSVLDVITEEIIKSYAVPEDRLKMKALVAILKAIRDVDDWTFVLHYAESFDSGFGIVYTANIFLNSGNLDQFLKIVPSFSFGQRPVKGITFLYWMAKQYSEARAHMILGDYDAALKKIDAISRKFKEYKSDDPNYLPTISNLIEDASKDLTMLKTIFAEKNHLHPEPQLADQGPYTSPGIWLNSLISRLDKVQIKTTSASPAAEITKLKQTNIQLQEMNTSLQDKDKRLQEMYRSLTDKSKRLQDECKLLQDKCKEDTEELKDKINQCEEKTSEIAKIQKSHEDLLEDHEKLAKAADSSWKKHNEEMATTMGVYSDALGTKESALKECRVLLAKLRTEAEKMRTEDEGLKIEVERLTSETRRIRAEDGELKIEVEKLKSETENLHAKQLELIEENKVIKSASEQEIKFRKACEQDLTGKTNELGGKEEKAKKLEEELTQEKKNVEDHKKELKRVSEDALSLGTTYEQDLTSKNNELKDMEEKAKKLEEELTQEKKNVEYHKKEFKLASEDALSLKTTYEQNLANKISKLKDMEEEAKKLTQEKKDAEDHKQELKTDLEKKIATLEQSASNLKEEIEAKKTMIQKMQEEINLAGSTNTSLKSEIENSKKELQTKTNELEKVNLQKETEKSNHEKAQKQLQEELKAKDAALEQSISKLHNLHLVNVASSSTIDTLRQTLTDEEKQKSQVQEELKQAKLLADKESQALKESLKQTELKLNDLQKSIGEGKRLEFEALSKEIEDLRKRDSDLKIIEERLQKLKDNLQKELWMDTSTDDSLESDIKSLNVALQMLDPNKPIKGPAEVKQAIEDFLQKHKKEQEAHESSKSETEKATGTLKKVEEGLAKCNNDLLTVKREAEINSQKLETLLAKDKDAANSYLELVDQITTSLPVSKKTLEKDLNVLAKSLEAFTTQDSDVSTLSASLSDLKTTSEEQKGQIDKIQEILGTSDTRDGLEELQAALDDLPQDVNAGPLGQVVETLNHEIKRLKSTAAPPMAFPETLDASSSKSSDDLGRIMKKLGKYAKKSEEQAELATASEAQCKVLLEEESKKNLELGNLLVEASNKLEEFKTFRASAKDKEEKLIEERKDYQIYADRAFTELEEVKKQPKVEIPEIALQKHLDICKTDLADLKQRRSECVCMPEIRPPGEDNRNLNENSRSLVDTSISAGSVGEPSCEEAIHKWRENLEADKLNWDKFPAECHDTISPEEFTRMPDEILLRLNAEKLTASQISHVPPQNILYIDTLSLPNLSKDPGHPCHGFTPEQLNILQASKTNQCHAVKVICEFKNFSC